MKIIKSDSTLFLPVFSDFFDEERCFDPFPAWGNDTWLPAANLGGDDESYEISVVVPCMQKENIRLEIEN